MGNKTLSQHLDVSEMEASLFMDSFERTYPAIRVFTKSVIEECKRQGFVETLSGRRRYLPDITSHITSRRSKCPRLFEVRLGGILVLSSRQNFSIWTSNFLNCVFFVLKMSLIGWTGLGPTVKGWPKLIYFEKWLSLNFKPEQICGSNTQDYGSCTCVLTNTF